jgi:hypothetical protein
MKKMIKRILFVFLITPLMLSSQALTGYDFTCRTMEILDPVKNTDEYYVVEETRVVDLEIAFYQNYIVIYDHMIHVAHELNVAFLGYDEDMNADVYSLVSTEEPGSYVFVFYDEGMLNICIEWIPEWDRYKNIYRLKDLTYIEY